MRKITNEELGRPSAAEFAAMEKMPVAVVLDNVRSLQNVGAFFRTCDAFAAERICLCGITATPPFMQMGRRPSLSSYTTVPSGTSAAPARMESVISAMCSGPLIL